MNTEVNKIMTVFQCRGNEVSKIENSLSVFSSYLEIVMITCITFVRPFVGPPLERLYLHCIFFTLSDIIKTLLSRKASPISFGKRLFTSLNCKATVAIFPYLPMKSHIPHFQNFASLYSFCIKFILRLSYFGPN